MMSRNHKLAVRVLFGLLAGVLLCCLSGFWALWPKVKLNGPMLSWKDVPSSRGTLDQLPLENGWVRYVIGDRNDTFYFSGQADELDITNLIETLPRKTVSRRHQVSIEEWRANTNFPGLPRDAFYNPSHDDVYRLEGRLNPHLSEKPLAYQAWLSNKMEEWEKTGRR